MKRFTERTIRDDYNNVDIIGVDLTKLYKELDDQQNPTLTFALNKLANLEDIEEEVGIDLITWFKAHIDGFYYLSDTKKGIEFDYQAPLLKADEFFDRPCEFYFDVWFPKETIYVKDYGKTWALTKEELEGINNEKINKKTSN